jgi:chaperonin GroES
MRVTLLGGRVLIRHALGAAQTDGGIVIPEAYRGKAQEGVVLAVAKGWWDPDEGFVLIEDLEVGDRVLFEKRKGQIIPLGDEVLRVIHYKDVLAVLRTGKAEVCPMCGGQGYVMEVDLREVPDNP